jgi:hypothetical protein
MVKKRALVEAAVKQAIDAVCKSGGGHPACPVVSGLLDLYLSSEFNTNRTPAPVGAGDRVPRNIDTFEKGGTMSLRVPERQGVPISVRGRADPLEAHGTIEQMVQQQLQGSTTWTDLTGFFEQYGLPDPTALVPLIASKFIVRGLRSHIGGQVPIGAGGRVVESIASRLSKAGVRRKLTGSARPGRFTNQETGFLG